MKIIINKRYFNMNSHRIPSIYKLLLFAVIVLGFPSCQSTLDSNSLVTNVSINRNSTEEGFIPFADSSTLASYAKDKSIINYNLARKLALIELDEAGFRQEQKWEGYHLSQRPVIVYGFDSKPVYYEFTVQDAEGKNVGTVSTQAKKKTGGIINEVVPRVKDYTTLFSKSKSTDMKIIASWRGTRFLGLLGKSGDSPETVIDPLTGEIVPSQTEPTDENIFKIVSDSIEQLDNYTKAQVAQIQDPYIKQLAIDADTVSTQTKIDRLQQSLKDTQSGRDAYWGIVNEYSDSISAATDDQIINKSSKSIFSFFKRLFDFKNDDPQYIEKYKKNLHYQPTANSGTYWCGPWCMSWIYNTNFGGDKYNYFESYAGTIGFGGLSYLFAATTNSKPMFVSEMCLSMTIASIKKGQLIWVNPYLELGQWDGYYHVRQQKGPILINTEALTHWIVAYGTKTTGSYLWRNYYYALSDNGHSISNKIGDYANYSSYLEPHWEKAPWFILYLRIYDK
jgi:hypothetical protein